MFRFTIRDVLWLTVVVAVVVAWWLHVQSVEEHNRSEWQEFHQMVSAEKERVLHEVEQIKQCRVQLGDQTASPDEN